MDTSIDISMVVSMDIYEDDKYIDLHMNVVEGDGHTMGGAFAPPMVCGLPHISCANLCICHLLVSFLLCRPHRSLGHAWRSGAVRPGRAKKIPKVYLFRSETAPQPSFRRPPAAFCSSCSVFFSASYVASRAVFSVFVYELLGVFSCFLDFRKHEKYDLETPPASKIASKGFEWFNS